MLVIPALERLRQEAYCKFKVSLGCRMRQCLKVKTKQKQKPTKPNQRGREPGVEGSFGNLI